MFKRLLGIKRVEKNIDKVNSSLSRSWEWISHLNSVNSSYEKRLSELENSQKKILDLINSLLDEETKEESFSGTDYPEQPFINIPSVKEAPVNLADKDLLILQIIYGYAAFNFSTAINTSKIADHLTYKITERGLRKKLKKLVEDGLLKSQKKGNTRFWYLNSDNLIKVKKALAEQ